LGKKKDAKTTVKGLRWQSHNGKRRRKGILREKADCQAKRTCSESHRRKNGHEGE